MACIEVIAESEDAVGYESIIIPFKDMRCDMGRVVDHINFKGDIGKRILKIKHKVKNESNTKLILFIGKSLEHFNL